MGSVGSVGSSWRHMKRDAGTVGQRTGFKRSYGSEMLMVVLSMRSALFVSLSLSLYKLARDEMYVLMW